MTAKPSKKKGYVKPKVRLVSWNKVLDVLRELEVDIQEFEKLFAERRDTRHRGPSPPSKAEVAAVSEYLLTRDVAALKTALKTALKREVSTQQAMGTVGRVFAYRLDKNPLVHEEYVMPDGESAPAKAR